MKSILITKDMYPNTSSLYTFPLNCCFQGLSVDFESQDKINVTYGICLTENRVNGVSVHHLTCGGHKTSRICTICIYICTNQIHWWFHI
jgi:hypothetical protein